MTSKKKKETSKTKTTQQRDSSQEREQKNSHSQNDQKHLTKISKSKLKEYNESEDTSSPDSDVTTNNDNLPDTSTENENLVSHNKSDSSSSNSENEANEHAQTKNDHKEHTFDSIDEIEEPLQLEYWYPSIEYETVYKIYQYFNKTVPFVSILCTIHDCYGNIEEAVFRIANGNVCKEASKLLELPPNRQKDKEAQYYL